MPKFKEFIAAVGKFHISAHVKECFALFSPNFIKGIGQVDSEILEMLWAALNLISKSARTMTTRAIGRSHAGLELEEVGGYG